MIFIVLCSVLLNINTFTNEYALDDEMVIGKNMNVHKGFAGIGTILSTDAYQGFLDHEEASTPLSGGRYRPLSIVSFAVEEQLFGEPLGQEFLDARKNLRTLQASATDAKQIEEASVKLQVLEKQMRDQSLGIAGIRHVFQVIYFALSMMVLFWFLHAYLLRSYPGIAFIATLLFVFHPIHTEVVANIKSRDEIFSLMFILLACIQVFRYEEDKKTKHLVWLFVWASCALLSKEYAVVLPVIALTAVAVVSRKKPLQLAKSAWFILLSVCSVILLLIRHNIVSKNKKFSLITDVLNEPYKYATAQQKIATKIATLDEYLKLLFFPHPLSADYSYSHYPYLTFANWQVWLSLIVWISVIVVTIKLWQKRHVLAFAGVFFLSFFMMVNNILFPIGATMGERLVYHSSLGFCIVIAWLMVKGSEKISSSDIARSSVLVLLTLLLIVPMGYKTIARNPDWKNDFTLFTRDVKYMTNAAMVNGNAGAEYYNKATRDIRNISKPTHQDTLRMREMVDTAKMYITRALTIHPHYVGAYSNRALCHILLGNLDSAIIDWKSAAANFNGRNPSLAEHAKMLLSIGKQLGEQKDYKNAARYLRDAALIDASSADIWDNLGGSEFMQGNFLEASQAFQQALAINPNLADAKSGYNVSNNFLSLQRKCQQDSMNADVWLDAARAYSQTQFKDLTRHAYGKVLELQPGNAEAKEAIRKTL